MKIVSLAPPQPDTVFGAAFLGERARRFIESRITPGEATE
jgi:hypothetical protein